MGSQAPGAPKVWHVFDGGRQLGPYSLSRLRSLWSEGFFSRAAVVLEGEQWVLIDTMLHNRADAADPPPEPEPVVPPTIPVAPAEGLVNLELVDETVSVTVAPLPAAPVAAAAPTAADDEEPQSIIDAPPPERDRIVIIGRRASGKTVYLSRLYEKLWRSTNDLSMKAVSGPVHASIMRVVDMLQHSTWPPATMASTRIETEVHYRGSRHVLVGLDYAGELFRQAFVEERTEQPEVRELLSHIDRAVAVILLVDPAVMVGGDVEEIMDDDFGIVQAAQRIRRWPGGEDIPIVLVLTKSDRHKALLDSYGSKKNFVAQHFPALHRLLKQIPIFAVSAVQVEPGPDGALIPRKDSVPVGLEDPLRYCLQAVHGVEERAAAEVRQREEQTRLARMVELEEKAGQRRQLTFAAIVAALIFIAICVIVLIIVFRG
jgi:hypothetical protein